MTPPVDILALGAHPDDVELGCGGGLLMAAQAGKSTAIIDFTAGERSSRGDSKRRAAERDIATSILQVNERICLGFVDGEVLDIVSTRNALIAEVRRLKPRVVLAPLLEDRHPDHAAVGEVARAACFLSGVAAMGPGAPHRPKRLFHYPIHQPTDPSFVVDITSVWDGKWKAINAYQSQFESDQDHGQPTRLSTGAFLRVIDARSVIAGALVGVERGEAYCASGPLGTDRLPGMEDDASSYRSFG